MRFLQSLLTIVASVSAQQAFNQILNPGANSVIQAGGGVQSITWTNLTSGNVSVALFSGSNPVVTVAPLADSIANTGTFLWTPETWLPSGNDYTIGVTDLSGAAPVQYSPFFTVQLCSTCSSSTRSTTTSFAAQTVSVSGLEIGTRTDAAFPTQAASASSASGVLSSGVANTASASVVSSGALPPASLPAGPAASGVSSASGASASASGSGGAAGAAPSSTTASGATFKQASAGLSVLFGAAVLLL